MSDRSMTINYDVPAKAALKKKFAEEAVFNEDGKSVTVGHFEAHRRSAWTWKMYVGFDCYDLDNKRAGLPSYFFIHANKRELTEAVEILSEKLAELHLSAENEKEGKKLALKAALAKLEA